MVVRSRGIRPPIFLPQLAGTGKTFENGINCSVLRGPSRLLRKRGALRYFFFFGAASTACLPSMTLCFSLAEALALPSFCSLLFCFDFGDLSPIMLCLWRLEVIDRLHSPGKATIDGTKHGVFRKKLKPKSECFSPSPELPASRYGMTAALKVCP